MKRYFQRHVVKLDRPVARRSSKLIFMSFAPRAIVEAILRIKSSVNFHSLWTLLWFRERQLLVQQSNASRRDLQNMHTSIANKAKVLRGRDCQQRVVVWTECQRIGVEWQRHKRVRHQTLGVSASPRREIPRI